MSSHFSRGLMRWAVKVCHPALQIRKLTLKVTLWVKWQIWDTNMEVFTPALESSALETAMAPHSSTLAWKIPWTEELAGCSPWHRYESDTTEWLHFHFSLSCIGEENCNPLQYSCLENPRDGGAWWAAVYGVTQSRTRLKRLSSSSSRVLCISEMIKSRSHSTLPMSVVMVRNVELG